MPKDNRGSTDHQLISKLSSVSVRSPIHSGYSCGHFTTSHDAVENCQVEISRNCRCQVTEAFPLSHVLPFNNSSLREDVRSERVTQTRLNEEGEDDERTISETTMTAVVRRIRPDAEGYEIDEKFKPTVGYREITNPDGSVATIPYMKRATKSKREKDYL